ncbi:MAG: hypothetical protein ACR2PL_21385 [Dehalococcoidia bacterium]
MTTGTSNGTFATANASASQLSELSNQTYLSYVDGMLRMGSRNINLAQNFLSQIETVQGQLRQAFEQAAEQTRVIQSTSRNLNSEFLSASVQVLEANRSIVQAFNSAFYQAGQRGADAAQSALNETRAAQYEARTRMSESANRAQTAGEIVVNQAKRQTGAGSAV